MLIRGGGSSELENTIPLIDAIAGDVVFCKPDGRLIIRREENTWENDETPIGIVVVPASHGVLKDGTGTINHCGVMSLVPMNYETAVTGGTSHQNINWKGASNTNISGKHDGLGRYDSTSNGLKDNYMTVYISKQSSKGSAPDSYSLNPYNDTDSELSNEHNVNYSNNSLLSDFSGIVNTKIITDLVSNWKNLTGFNNYLFSNYPAALCCGRFKTKGTKSFSDCSTEELKNGTGFWYLPAIGELGYILPRFADINYTIEKLKFTYGDLIGTYLDGNYWSSTENATDGAYEIYMYNGGNEARYTNKTNGLYVRAFMQLGPDDVCSTS